MISHYDEETGASRKQRERSQDRFLKTRSSQIKSLILSLMCIHSILVGINLN
ncbi:hypothetical protein RchiOBHm_Chr4g0388671 [Rosa chinensis]|uniref:Uncharacterized protein n=1 Tax=Rosa chinensis TaxID=74649 RepID=A0A2P6QPW6_ROSCH|nr:hypothetical protein RchiOBHm_Chr4g0388671 [Rosa chinensis]